MKMDSLNDQVLAEAEGEMLYWDQVYRRYKLEEGGLPDAKEDRGCDCLSARSFVGEIGY